VIGGLCLRASILVELKTVSLMNGRGTRAFNGGFSGLNVMGRAVLDRPTGHRYERAFQIWPSCPFRYLRPTLMQARS